jgi:phosphatidylinositol-3-phosphatase
MGEQRAVRATGWRDAVVVLAAASLLVVGCARAQHPAPRRAAGPRVIVVVEENHAATDVIGSPSAPFLTSLARQGTLLTSFFATTHPSLPNYIAMLGGDTFGIDRNCTDCTVAAPSLVDQLEAAGIDWRAYMQGLPELCSDASRDGAYVKKHNPFMYFQGIRRSAERCGKVVPFEEFDADVAAGRLPQFVFVTPDLEHDMHDGPVSVADAWLRDFVQRLRASSAWREDTRLVVTFDEGNHGDDAGCCGGLAAGGRVAAVVIGPRVPAGQDPTAYSHYSLLRSIETLFGLSYLGHAADPATAPIPSVAHR